MHTYATDVDRQRVPIILAVLSIGTALLFIYVIQALEVQIPWWIDAPSVMGFYAIFYSIYDKTLWKLHFDNIRLSHIPDVNGVWAGELTSSYNNGTKIDIVFYIVQTWSKISIRTETITSTSSTTMAALNTEEYLDPGLQYEYLSEPGAFATPTMQIHRGTGHLRLSANGQILSGDYYTGRGRQTTGTIELHFISKKRIDREEALKRMKSNQSQASN